MLPVWPSDDWKLISISWRIKNETKSNDFPALQEACNGVSLKIFSIKSELVPAYCKIILAESNFPL